MRKSISKLFAAVLSAAVTFSTFSFVPGLFSITVSAVTTNVGDVITLGKYEQDNNLSNGSEDIEWIVLDKKDGKVLLLSKYGLDAKAFHEVYGESVTWETSSLRAWLNNDFYSTAFSPSEQSSILETTNITADSGPYYDYDPNTYEVIAGSERYTDGGNNTNDKVFCLSYDEANNYFSTNEERVCIATSYAINNGAYVIDSEANDYLGGGYEINSCYWWLRSMGENNEFASDVPFTGFPDNSGYFVSYSEYCVRPAIWITDSNSQDVTPGPTTNPASVVSVETNDYVYQLSGVAHVQDYGDTKATFDGTTLKLGTTGQSKRVEAITIYFNNNTGYSGTLQYRVHVQDIGWMDWVDAGQMAGTSGLAKRLEGIEMRLTGDLANYYSVQYSVHIQDYGDAQGWVGDGALAGTTGESKRLEEVRVKLVPRNSANTTSVKYRVHIQDYGWESSWKTDGSMSGTSGQAKRLEGIEIHLSGTQYSGGIKFKTHVQDYGWQGWSYDGEMSGTQGESKRLEGICIELYGEIANHYDIYYRVHAQDIGWMGWAKNGECAGTAGRSARLEGIQIVLVPKGSPAPGATYQGITAVNSSAFVEGYPQAPANPSPAPASNTSQPSSNPTPISNGVYITSTGSKYHKYFHGQVKPGNTSVVPLVVAKALGYGPCDVCC